MIRPDTSFSGDWFAHRYGIAAPSVDSARFAISSGHVDVWSLRPRPEDASRLWSGLEADLAPNQALVEKRGVIGLVISTSADLRRKVVTLIRPAKQAQARSDLDWLTAEMPRDIPGLKLAYALFLSPLPDLEKRANGVGVRAVYQASYTLSRVAGPKGLAQADFWVPRTSSQTEDLVHTLDAHKTSEQTIMSGKDVAVVVSTRTNEATQIVVNVLKEKGYKLESRVARFKG